MGISSKLKNKGMIVAIALLALILLAIAPSVYPPGMTVISISQIYVSPEGSNVAGKWVGSYWNILATVQADARIAGLTIPENQTGTVTIGTIQKTLKTGAKLLIQIEPLQPYFVRKIVKKDVLVSPLVGRTASLPSNLAYLPNEYKTSAVYAHHYEWAEPAWRRYTPYWINVVLDGKGIGTKLVNTEGQDAVQTVETSKGTIRIEHLGALQSEYMTPETPTQIAIFDQTNVYDLAQITPYYAYDTGLVVYQQDANIKIMQSTSSQAYSTYWFGANVRWTADGAPAGFVPIFGGYQAIDTNAYGGWLKNDDLTVWRRDPVAPPVYSTDKSASSFPASKRGFLSMLEYFDYKGCVNLADASQGAQTIFSKYQGWSINSTSSEVRLNVPWGAYATPVVNIRVPTELVDTWVEQPQISDVQPVATWQDGSKHTSISAGQTVRLKVHLTQKSTVQSSTAVVVSSNQSKLTLYPLNKVVSLAPNATLDTFFDVTNNNPNSDITGAVILVRCLETYMNTETGRDTVTVDLDASRLNGTTTLNVLCMEKTSQVPIVGLQLQVQYAVPNALTKSGFTGQNGEQTFSLDLPAGGSYYGEIQVSTEQTVKYQPAFRTAIVSPGLNSVTVEVLLAGEEEQKPGFDWTWIIVALGVCATAVSVGAVAKRRKWLK